MVLFVLREYGQGKLNLLRDFPMLTIPFSAPVLTYPLLENELSKLVHQNFGVYHNTQYIIKPKSN